MERGNRITTVNLRWDLVDKAQRFGINLSQFLNARLDDFFNGSLNPSQGTQQKQEAPDMLVHMSDGFKKWLKLNNAPSHHIKSLERYLSENFKGLILSSPQNVLEYISRMKKQSKYPILALRKYIKYLEETQQITFDHARHLNRVLIIKRSNPDNYLPSDEEVKQAYSKLTDEKDKLIFLILAFSGSRVAEMVKMLSEYEPTSLVKKDEYMRYSLNYQRGQKNSFHIYLPIELSGKLHKFYKLGRKSASNMGGRAGLNPKYLRKWFYNKVIMASVPESVADFYEGRSPATVGSANYLSKTKQGDHWYETAMETLKQTIPI
jgi:intergrase/recombinase